MANLMIRIIFMVNCFLNIHCSYHWVVTENSKIQPQVENSGFPLTKSNDIMALLEQEKRLTAINSLYKELLALKKSIGIQWAKIESEGDLEKRLYSTDIDCLLGGIPLSQHNLNTEFLDYVQGSRPKMKNDYDYVEPDCTAYSDLDFSMRTFPHLDTLNKRDSINSISNPVPSKTVFDYNIDAMLKVNSTDWTAYNIASLYWRSLGNGTNAVECARRALYFSPMSERYLALLNLGTLLQELHSLGEAAIVLHSAIDHDPVQHISHLALGNVYAELGDYRRSLACYDNVLSLNPGNMRALQLKHALLCRKKLESGLLEIHASLQAILQDLQRHNSMHEDWLTLQNQVSWEKDSKVKEFFSLSQPLYLKLRMLLQNVEQQARTMNEEVSRKVSKGNDQMKREEKNQLKLETIFDCDSENCPSYMRHDKDEKMNTLQNKVIEKRERNRKTRTMSPLHLNKNRENEDEEDEEDEKEKEKEKTEVDMEDIEDIATSDPLLKDRMNALIKLLKSQYDQDIKLIGVKRRKNVNHKLTGLPSEEVDVEAAFPVDRSYLLKNLDACVKESSDFKKLN